MRVDCSRQCLTFSESEITGYMFKRETTVKDALNILKHETVGHFC